jgi:hypothetical protein
MCFPTNTTVHLHCDADVSATTMQTTKHTAPNDPISIKPVLLDCCPAKTYQHDEQSPFIVA